MSFIQAQDKYLKSLAMHLRQFNDIDLLKKRLTYSRWKVAENLDKLLFEFETNVKKNNGQIAWCPDAKNALEQLNKHINNFNQVTFFKHNAVKHFVKYVNIAVPEPPDQPEVVVIGAKFTMANSGSFYSVLADSMEYQQVLKAKKIIVIAGVDSMIALQSELYAAKQLYALYETGNLHYPFELLAKPGKLKGLQAEVILLLTDINKHALLEQPQHRALFNLLNFDLPPVCPMQRLSGLSVGWESKDTLSQLLATFIDPNKGKSFINHNYGLRLLNQFLPYDIDLYEHILMLRAEHHQEDKKGFFSGFSDKDKSGLVLQPKKFKDPEKFEQYAQHHFGKII